VLPSVDFLNPSELPFDYHLLPYEQCTRHHQVFDRLRHSYVCKIIYVVTCTMQQCFPKFSNEEIVVEKIK
jgi:hypothetical protein